MVRRSAPDSSMCVAKQCLRVCGVTRFLMPARTQAWRTAAQTIFSVMIECIQPENVHDWRTIRWEITNSYLVDDWERAFQLYDRAAQLALARAADLLLMRGHLQFLLAFYRDPLSQLEEALQSTCYTRKPHKPLHPFNWEPRIYDSQALPLSLLLL